MYPRPTMVKAIFMARDYWASLPPTEKVFFLRKVMEVDKQRLDGRKFEMSAFSCEMERLARLYFLRHFV